MNESQDRQILKQNSCLDNTEYKQEIYDALNKILQYKKIIIRH